MLDQYRRMEVETATPGELILMVYDSTIRSLEKAKFKLSQNKVEEANEFLFKAQDCIAELMNALNLDVGDIAKSLHRLYTFMLNHLNDVMVKKQRKSIDETIALLNSLKETWEEILKRETGRIVVQA